MAVWTQAVLSCATRMLCLGQSQADEPARLAMPLGPTQRDVCLAARTNGVPFTPGRCDRQAEVVVVFTDSSAQLISDRAVTGHNGTALAVPAFLEGNEVISHRPCWRSTLAWWYSLPVVRETRHALARLLSPPANGWPKGWLPGSQRGWAVLYACRYTDRKGSAKCGSV